MKRTTIMLPEDLDARIRFEARRRGVSIADVAREALEHHLSTLPSSADLSFVAIGDGEPADVSERVDEFVGGAISARARS